MTLKMVHLLFVLALAMQFLTVFGTGWPRESGQLAESWKPPTPDCNTVTDEDYDEDYDPGYYNGYYEEEYEEEY